MSKTHVKPTHPEPAPAPPPREAGAAPADTGAAAVVPAAPPTAPAPDAHHGHGGLYVRVAGQRTLTERTAPPTPTISTHEHIKP